MEKTEYRSSPYKLRIFYNAEHCRKIGNVNAASQEY